MGAVARVVKVVARAEAETVAAVAQETGVVKATAAAAKARGAEAGDGALVEAEAC